MKKGAGVGSQACELWEARAASRGNAVPRSIRGFPQLALFDVALSETKVQEARGASRGNGVLGATDADSLSLRFGLQSRYFLTDFFADRRERATSKLALRASKHGVFCR